MTMVPTISHTALSPVELVGNYFAAFATGDIEAALKLMTEDVVWHIDGSTQVSTVGLLRGHAGVRSWLGSFPQNFQPQAFAIRQLIESADTVVAHGYFRHSVISTGNAFSGDFVILFTIRDGLIARYQIFEDSAALSRAFDPDSGWQKQRVRLKGVEYAYSDRGNGPVVMFSHGLFVDRTFFEAQVAALEKHYRCIVLDMPGHSESGFEPQGWGLDSIAEDLALMIEELSLGQVTFIGHSQGGMVGMRLAARHPELISRLILIGSSARAEYPQRVPNWQALRHTLLQGSDAERTSAFKKVQCLVCAPEWLSANDKLLAEELAIMLAHDRMGLTLALDAATISRQDCRPLLAGIQAPTLVICGDRDIATPFELSQEIAEAIPASRLEIMAGIGHHPPLEAPQALSLLIAEFLQSAL
ncbi:alpha/beta fold hydrolase [Serratia aquatilis]|uniref:Alpha/beta fold hydrolase n=1 Tax=Serratia aquatilis TaxID=1737515 RepID=A0ABV6EG55_9GAMM